jgi:hypothetical protein
MTALSSPDQIDSLNVLAFCQHNMSRNERWLDSLRRVSVSRGLSATASLLSLLMNSQISITLFAHAALIFSRIILLKIPLAIAMDPLSITTSVTALAALCGQVVILCSRIPGRKASMHRTLSNLKVEVSSYQRSLCIIEDLLIDQDGLIAKTLSAKNEWTESFDTALSGCSITISILISMLEKIITRCTGSTLKFTLEEQDLKDLIGELRGQSQGVQLLISTLQL